MRQIFVLVLVCLLVEVFAAPNPAYTTKFDNINIDEVLASDRLLYNYVKCLKGTGNCTPDGIELKNNLPDALETDCAKCSETQKSKSKAVVSYLVNKKPEWWQELSSTYDPDGKYKTKYEAEFKALKEGSK